MDELRNAGRAIMAGSSVAICGLARDCANNLQAIIPQIERLAATFACHRIIVVENDSRDRTGSVVGEWCQRDTRVRLVQFSYRDTLEATGEPVPGGRASSFGERRMQRMAFARNQYLEALTEGSPPDFVVVVDLDIRSFSLPGVEHSFGLLDEWDVVTANGKRYSARNPLRSSVYWDSYAYEPAEGFQEGVQTPDQLRYDQARVAALLKRGCVISARSAFGGLGIYRAGLLTNHRYSVIKNDSPHVPVLCDHPTLHRSIRQQHKDFRLVINPHMTVNYGTALQLVTHAWRAFTK